MLKGVLDGGRHANRSIHLFDGRVVNEPRVGA
jgi:hypothetical protein